MGRPGHYLSNKEFIDVAMRLNPADKMCGNGKMEKHILHECFEHYLPESIMASKKCSLMV